MQNSYLIVMTAVTVVLAVLAVIIAILAVWGYQSIKNEAASAATRAVEATVSDAVRKHVSDERLRAIAKEEVAFREKAAIEQSAEYTEAFTVTEQDARVVGKEYPKDKDVDEGQTS